MRKNYLFFACALLSAGLTAQTFTSGLTAPLNPVKAHGSKKEKLSDPSTWTEQVELRTLYTSTYRTPEGQVVTSTSSRPINYYKNGKLVPIDYKLKMQTGDSWSAPDQPFPTYLYANGEAAVTLDNGKQFLFGNNCRINGQKIQTHFSFTGNTVRIPDVVPGIDKEFIYYENYIKYNYILNNQVAAPDNFFHVSEDLYFPKGYKLVKDEKVGREENGGWCGDLVLLNEKGEAVSRIMAPICYDANKQWTIATYLLSETNGVQTLEMILPVSWLNDPARTFPVVLDPVVIGPTSLWTGGQMPSCIMPVHNQDSLLVTVPAGITVTDLYVTSSYYADPFTTAVMSQGNMYFTTDCGQTSNFTVPNPTGNTPGTAYLDSFDLHSPLMCCWPQTCSTYTFWLSMHLGRTGPSTGCNTTYIRYDPFTTAWPFKALVVGRTIETWGNQWQVPNTPICSNECTITGKVFIRYGVPPFTITHPWGGTVVQGTPQGCSNAAIQYTFNLTIPNCPVYCTSATSITVPPPTVTDACGNVLTGLPSRTVPLKNAPDINATPTSAIVCSGSPYTIALTSCIPGDTTHWFGNNTSGIGNLSDVSVNTGTSANTINYSAYATANGCYSDTITIPITVDPLPSGNFSWSPNPPIAGIPITFYDVSTVYAGTTNNWFWNFGNNNTTAQQTPTHTFGTPGTYQVCLEIATDHGCIDTICLDIDVIPADVFPPNVITPNGDGINDLLKFQYLEFYPGNRLEIYDRWGAIIYEKDSYANDWNGKVSDGTYYYILKVADTGKDYKGFFQVLH